MGNSVRNSTDVDVKDEQVHILSGIELTNVPHCGKGTLLELAANSSGLERVIWTSKHGAVVHAPAMDWITG